MKKREKRRKRNAAAKEKRTAKQTATAKSKPERRTVNQTATVTAAPEKQEPSNRGKGGKTQVYKLGKNSVIKITVGRGAETCEIVIPDNTLSNQTAVSQVPAARNMNDKTSSPKVKASTGIRQNNAAVRNLSDGTAE